MAHVRVDSCLAHAEKEEDHSYAVFPDLWVSFVPRDPSINPHYDEVMRESNAYMMTTLGCTWGEYNNAMEEDYTLYAAIQLPNSPADKLKTCADWYQWVFAFDDQFDEGGIFTTDPGRGIRHAQDMLSVFEDRKALWTGNSPLREVYASLWERFRAGMTKDAADLYAQRNKDFLNTIIRQATMTTKPTFQSLEEWFNIRRVSIGVLTGFTFSLYTHDLTLPKAIIESPHIQEIEYTATEIVMLSNDIISYLKEGTEHAYNTITLLRKMHGYSVQQAFDEAGRLISERFKEWEDLESTLPSWDLQMWDAQVRVYLDGVKGHVIANMNWSFVTKRMFGTDGPTVKKTRRIHIPPEFR